MIHSEPVSAIDQDQREDQRHHVSSRPPTLRVHVQEIDHVHDDLRHGEHRDRRIAVAILLSSTPVITSQNGIAVRTTERPKPVR